MTRPAHRMQELRASAVDRGFGVRVQAAGLGNIFVPGATTQALQDLVTQHRVVILEDLYIDADAFVALAGTLGTLRPARVRSPDLPGPAGDYLFVSARDARSIPASVGPADAGHMWHIDYSQSRSLPQLSMLYAVKAPANGSRTSFADMACVHASLPLALRQEVGRRSARHYQHPQGVDAIPTGQSLFLPWAVRDQGVAHPLVMQDRRGHSILCLPPRRDSPVVGLDEVQSRELLDQLWSYVETHGQLWEYEQASRELVIWDNRALLHKRSPWPLKEERLLWFLTTH